MGLSVIQLRRHIVRPTLQKLGLWSEVAENLVVGTAAHESGGFRFLDQITSTEASDEKLGPAFGLYQIEPATMDDMWDSGFLRDPRHRRYGEAAVMFLATSPSRAEQLATNLCWATAICRLRYYRAQPPLPADPNDLDGIAGYWKAHYNTAAGKGTTKEFADDYRRYVR